MKHGTGDSYETPDALYEALDDIFNFKVDAFADSENAKCDIYMSEKDSALDQEWPDCGSVWMNPPYSRELIKRCTQKAYEESVVVPDRYIIALVRDDPTTKWYDQFIDGKAAELWRLKHRLTFKGAANCYNFPCCLVIYNNNIRKLPAGETKYSRWWYE